MSVRHVPSEEKSIQKYDTKSCIYRRGNIVEIVIDSKLETDSKLSQFNIELQVFKTNIDSNDIVINKINTKL